MTTQLQQLVGRWHEQKFPDAFVFEVTTKSAEELGEHCAEVLIDLSKSMSLKPKPISTQAPAEAADVVICLMAILERWYPGYDLIEEVEKKMDILTDPNSGHRAAMELV